ncbi:small, acid-soluble spore protein, alpha/beta type [Syntrophomonas wolfei]|uniref:small, acid-soluble spore protein, alpha/beta type n=1 Tax=Syntrophomonas wolfei TaxID=863 RepID=UPI0023F2E043|nr:small, acid-soluble spore protein, alpha/beta type [Syntrophomonas wolfei]
MSEKDLLKIEIAKELGIWEQVEKEGWDSLSNATCGRVGGLMSKRLRDSGAGDNKKLV